MSILDGQLVRVVGARHTRRLTLALVRTRVLQRLACERDARVVVGVDRLAEVDGILELLAQHGLARVVGQLQQEEARVALGQEAVGWVELVDNLR